MEASERTLNMATKDRVYGHFITEDCNCSESILKSINEEYSLGLDADHIRLISAFGAGMGCGRTCGALSGGLAALGYMKVQGRAHATKNFSPLCKGYVEKFEHDLGSTVCAELKPRYRNDKTRCLLAVQLGADVFDEYLKSLDDSADDSAKKENVKQ